MTVIEADIEDITRTLWSTLFDLPLSVAPAVALGPGPVVTGCVQIVGEWRGAVMLQCPISLAEILTEQMYQAELAPTLDEVRDALGELTNVIGGNVKALFPGPSRISLPSVAVGTDYELGVVETSSITEVPFICGGYPLRVKLFEGHVNAELPEP